MSRMLHCLFFCLLWPYLVFSQPAYDLVVCAVFQNESFFLKEWIEFHKLMGVQHFYLYNNLSTDNYREILEPYISTGLVDLIDWPIEARNQKEYLDLIQLPTYRHALQTAQQTARWAAFIDLDEFMVPHRHRNLIELLKEYDAYPGLVLNWQIYGTSGVDHLNENDLIIERLTLKAPSYRESNQMVKSIVKPKLVKEILDPHSFIFYTSLAAVDTDRKPITPGCSRKAVLTDVAQINHYWFGTKEWFLNNKLKRREKWGIVVSPVVLDSFIAQHNAENGAAACKRFIPQLKATLYGVLPLDF